MSPAHQCQSSQGPQPLSSLEGERHGGSLGTLATASTWLLLRPHASVGNSLFSGGIISDESQKQWQRDLQQPQVVACSSVWFVIVVTAIMKGY